MIMMPDLIIFIEQKNIYRQMNQGWLSWLFIIGLLCHCEVKPLLNSTLPTLY